MDHLTNYEMLPIKDHEIQPENCDTNSPVVLFRGNPYRKRTILADANIPYNLTLDRNTNSLFFCINSDEFSDQSFHSVILNLNTGTSSVIPGVRNGFASTVDNSTGTVYLGGSDGIYRFNYDLNDVEKPSIVGAIDIFDMYFKNELYYVDTALQNLYSIRNSKKSIISEVQGCLIHHFAIDKHDDLFFINSSGLYLLPKGAKNPVRQENVSRDLNFRGIATDASEQAYFIAQGGVYAYDKRSELVNVLPVENGYGLAFDKENNIIFSVERTVFRLTPVKS